VAGLPEAVSTGTSRPVAAPRSDASAGDPEPALPAEAISAGPAQPVAPATPPQQGAFEPVAVPPAHETREAVVVPDESFRPEVSTDIDALTAPDVRFPGSAFAVESAAAPEPEAAETEAATAPQDDAAETGAPAAAPVVSSLAPRQPAAVPEIAPARSPQAAPLALPEGAATDAARSAARVPGDAPQGSEAAAPVPPSPEPAQEASAVPGAEGEAALRGGARTDPAPGSATSEPASGMPSGPVADLPVEADRPRLAVIVSDESAIPVDVEEALARLDALPLPVSVALDAAPRDASARAAAYRAAGVEVIALLTQGFDGPTAEVARRVTQALEAVPGADAVMVDRALPPEALRWLVEHLGAMGHAVLVRGAAATASLAQGGDFAGLPVSMAMPVSGAMARAEASPAALRDAASDRTGRAGDALVVVPLDRAALAALADWAEAQEGSGPAVVKASEVLRAQGG
jgi:hypothetical protein